MTKILVIEDDQTLCEEVRDYLQFSGYEVDTAENGLIGVEKALATIPDLIVCDIMMPKLDGYGVLLELRSKPSTIDIPFIFLTARVEKKDFRYAMHLGADDYITKPFKFKDIAEAIEIRLEKYQRARAKYESEIATLNTQFNTQKQHNLFSAELLSMISHDMKTPLASIMSSASIIKNYSDQLTDERRVHHAEHIIQATFRTLEMLEDLMTFGKLEAGVLKVEPVEIRLLPLVQSIIHTINPSDDETHNILVEAEGHEHCTVWGDESLVRHAILNLLTNAMKYSARGSNITIYLEQDHGKTILAVQDEGIGIPEKDLSNLFTAFQRATNVGTIVGTGLGLAVVKLAADLNHGEIRWDSEEGKGSVFILSLPCNSNQVIVNEMK